MTENEQIEEMKEEFRRVYKERYTKCLTTDCRICPRYMSTKFCLTQIMAETAYAIGYRKVERGEWIEKTHEWDFGPPWDYTDYTCSICGSREQNKRIFCPECGAYMRKEGEGK